MIETELIRLETEGEAEQLREMKDRHADVFLEHLRRVGLLAVEIEVTERTWRYEQVGAFFLSLDDVIAAHRERFVAIESKHREPAALGRPAILDRFRTEQRDQPLQVRLTFGTLAKSERLARA